MRNICRVIGLGARVCTRIYTRRPVWARFYLPASAARVCRYVCPSIMATITRSVHSVSFFLCLPRLFHPSVLATVPSALTPSSPRPLPLTCAHVYYIMRNVDPIPLKQPSPSGVFIPRRESLGGDKNAFGVRRVRTSSRISDV